jgi:hypothetical protein
MPDDFREWVEGPERSLRREIDTLGRVIVECCIGPSLNWHKVPAEGRGELVEMAPRFRKRLRDSDDEVVPGGERTQSTISGWEFKSLKSVAGIRLDHKDLEVLEWKIDVLLHARSPA